MKLKTQKDIEKEKLNWERIVIRIITFIIVIIVLIEIYNYPKDYQCYQYECTETNLEDFNKCVDIGYEGCGFLCYNHYYLCDGIKVVEKCLKTEEINQNVEVNMLDILSRKCSSLK